MMVEIYLRKKNEFACIMNQSGTKDLITNGMRETQEIN